MASRAAAQAHKPNAAHNAQPNRKFANRFGLRISWQISRPGLPTGSISKLSRSAYSNIYLLFINYWSCGLCLLIFQFIYRSNCLIVFRDRQLFPALSGESSYKSCITIASLSKDGHHDTAVRVLHFQRNFSVFSL